VSADVYPDIEGALRTWLRTQTALTAVVGSRIFFGVPRSVTETDFPMVALFRVGGGNDRGDAPIDIALVQFDVWGKIDASGNGVKAGATTAVNALRATLQSVNGPTLLDAHTTCHGITVESVVWLPNPDDDRPRYVVTAEVTSIRT